MKFDELMRRVPGFDKAAAGADVEAEAEEVS